MKLKRLFFAGGLSACLCIGSTGTMMAQDNVAKLGITSLAYTTVSLTYERVLGDHLGTQLTFQLMPGRALPGVGGVDGVSVFTDAKMSYFSLSPEFRYYPSDKGAPRGFYIGPFIKYSRFKIGASQSTTIYDDSGVGTFVELDVAFKVPRFGGGLIMGTQWLIADKFSIDWTWFGLGYAATTGKLQLESNIPGVTEGLENELEAVEDDLSVLGNASVTSSGDKVTLAVSRPLPMLKFGITFGWAF